MYLFLAPRTFQEESVHPCNLILVVPSKCSSSTGNQMDLGTIKKDFILIQIESQIAKTWSTLVSHKLFGGHDCRSPTIFTPAEEALTVDSNPPVNSVMVLRNSMPALT